MATNIVGRRQAKARTVILVNDETGDRLEPWQFRAGMITTATTYDATTNMLTVRLRRPTP